VAYMAVGGMPELLEIAEEAREAALAAADDEAAVLPSIQVALALMAGGEADRALPLLAQYEQFLRDADPIGPMNEVLGMVAVCLAWVEEFHRAEAIAGHLVSGARSAGATRALAFPLGVHAFVLTRLGDFTRASLEADEAVALADETAHGMVLAFTLGVAARIDALIGQGERARERAQRSLDIARDLGLNAVAPYGHSALGLAELVAGNPDAAFEHLHEADRAARTAGVIEQGCMYLTADSLEAAIRARRTDDARRALAQLDEDLALVDRAFTRMAIARYSGVLAPDDELDAHFAEAFAQHERLPMPVERARTLLLYGERLRRARRRREARVHLQEAAAEFDRLGAKAWAGHARRECEAATGTGRQSAQERAPDEPLTPQESRVAELVATGATNKEIAERLFLSPRTVEFHLRGAFRKLGVHTRTQLAAGLRESR
jgi:ATP/maltotriose-dependent transcriptional regulator MalT